MWFFMQVLFYLSVIDQMYSHFNRKNCDLVNVPPISIDKLSFAYDQILEPAYIFPSTELPKSAIFIPKKVHLNCMRYILTKVTTNSKIGIRLNSLCSGGIVCNSGRFSTLKSTKLMFGADSEFIKFRETILFENITIIHTNYVNFLTIYGCQKSINDTFNEGAIIFYLSRKFRPPIAEIKTSLRIMNLNPNQLIRNDFDKNIMCKCYINCLYFYDPYSSYESIIKFATTHTDSYSKKFSLNRIICITTNWNLIPFFATIILCTFYVVAKILISTLLYCKTKI